MTKLWETHTKYTEQPVEKEYKNMITSGRKENPESKALSFSLKFLYQPVTNCPSLI